MDEKYLWVALAAALLVAATILKNRYSCRKQRKKCESPIEIRLFEELYKKGYKPYTQVSCGKYRIDIALQRRGRKYAIECDGAEFHSSKEQLEHDKKKDEILEKNRWRVMRFTGKDINGNLESCISKIERTVK